MRRLPDFDPLWDDAVAAINSGVGLTISTNILPDLQNTTTEYDANMHIRRTDEFEVRFTNYQHLAGINFSNRRFEFSVPVTAGAYSMGLVRRMRVYVQYEVTGELDALAQNLLLRMDGGGWNSPVTYSHLTKTDENLEDRFGWDYTFGDGTPSLDAPTNMNEDVTVRVYPLATNRVWVLIADVESPTNPPVFVLGPSDLVSESYTYPQPEYGLSTISGYFTYEDHGVRLKTYKAFIAHSALVIDWNFKVFGSTPYVPIETNKPGWIP